MPRIRSVHPDICDDEVIAVLSPYAFRTWVLLWTHLDDKGRGVDSPKLWAGKLYPLNDKMTEERVERDLSELVDRGLLYRYEVDGRRYLTAKPEAWARWQKPQHPTPSKLPEPPLSTFHPSPQEPLSNSPENLTSGSGGRGGEGRGAGEEGESEGEAASRPPVDNVHPLAARAARHAGGAA
jgi:hypothetical protein